MNTASSLESNPALDLLAQRLKICLKHPGATYTVNRKADLETLNALSPADLHEFGKRNGYNIVRRMGGTIYDFTPVGREVY